MYIVSRSNDEKYGNVIAILRADEGELSPFFAVENCKKQKRLWFQEEGIRSRFMVDGQILTITELEKWAHDEYQSLPKCLECVKILYDQVFTNVFADGSLFCSQFCADSNYHRQMDHLTDYEECDL